MTTNTATSPGLTGSRRWTPASVSAVYFALSSVYIVVSDIAVFSADLQGTTVWLLGLAKGLVFVVATTVLLYVLLSRRQHEIDRREQFLATVLDGADAAIFVVDQDRTIMSANAAAEAVFGRPRGELQGRSTRVLHVSDESWRAFHGLGWDILESGQPFRTEYPMRRADGTEFTASVNVSLVRFPEGGHAAVSIVDDVTEERAREEELRHSRTLLRQVVENIDSVFWLTTPDSSEMLYVSPAFERIWGQSVEALHADPMLFTRTVHPDDLGRVRAFVRRQPHEDQTVEYRIVRPGGQVRWIRDRSFRILDGNGIVYRCAGIAEDITEEKESQRLLLAAQKREALGQIAGGVAHDFNNMLLVVMGNIEMVLDTQEDARRKTALQTALRAAERGSELAARLLAFGRADVLQPVPTDLAAAVRDAQEIVARAVGARIAVDLKAQADLPLVQVDRGQFESAMLNLALNARDAMQGSGTLTFEVSLADDPDGDGRRVRVAVTDTGAGMDEDVLARAIEPFFTTKAKTGGSGLGLSSVHAFVRQSGGRMALRSRPGAGTTVSLCFPPARRVRDDEEEPGPGRARARPALGRRRAVLVTEGDPHAAATIRQMIEHLGHTAVVAGSSDEALAAFGRTAGIDTVLSDIVIPGRHDGLELVRLLRRQRSDLDLWLTSGQPGEALQLPGRLPDGVRLLVKPVRTDTLKKIL